MTFFPGLSVKNVWLGGTADDFGRQFSSLGMRREREEQVDRGALIKNQRIGSLYAAEVGDDMVDTGGQGHVDQWACVVKREYQETTGITDIQTKAGALARRMKTGTPRSQATHCFAEVCSASWQFVRSVNQKARH